MNSAKAIRNLALYRGLITRSVLLFFIMILLWRLYSHLLPCQLQKPVLSRIDMDYALWAYKLLNIDGYIIHNTIGSVLFTVVLFIIAVLFFLKPQKNIYAIVFTALFWLLALSFNLYLTHNTHLLPGMMLILIPFCVRKDTDFEILWEGMRYFACWVYFSSLLWKMINGSFWQPDFGIESLKENVAYILYEDPAGKLAFLYRFFLEHPLLTNTGAKLIFLLEGFFIVGFFTKKWDKLLFVLIFLIHGLLCFFADVVFIELCVLAFLFIPAAGWARLQTWVSSLKRGSSA